MLRERFERLRQKHCDRARGSAKAALQDPAAYVTAKLKKPARDGLIQFWESLDDSIRVGNSVVDDAAVDSAAFDWHRQFPEVFQAGGFDVVIANPPYIRQEWLARFKPHWEQRFRSYSGTADIFTYFFELGVDLLREGGRLGYITSGTFARANFAGPFRSWFPTAARIERLVNFGENQPFEGAEMV